MCILKYDAIKDARRVKITRRFKFFPCNIWKLLRYIFVLNVNNFYTYICVYPVPYFGLIALIEFQCPCPFYSAFLLSLWLNEIALSKVIKMYFMTVCVIKFQKEIHTGFSSTPNLKPWFYALSPVYNSKLMTWKHWNDWQTYVYILASF